MAYVLPAESGVRDPADGDHVAILRKLRGEVHTPVDLGSGGWTIRGDRAGVRGNHVPEEHVILEPELAQHAVHDRRRRLRGTGAGELTLRREGDPRHPRAPVAGGFADHEDPRISMRLEIGAEALAQERRPRSVGVLVERAPDPRCGELVHECVRRYDGTSVTGSSGQPG